MLIQSIRNWLAVNVPQFVDIVIAESGKFLGWHLGRHSATLSYAAPIKKFSHRVQEICIGKAPVAVALVRYNQRVVPVLSYVAQFAVPPDCYKISALAHRSVHSVLRMPGNSMSRQLTNSVGFCSGISPLSINSYCASVRYRFAVSEASYLEQLRADIFAYVGNFAALSSYGLILPHGGIDTPCILGCLHDALALKGPLNSIFAIANRVPEHNWLTNYPISRMPSCYKGIQSAVYKILTINESCADLSRGVVDKLRITFPISEFGIIPMQDDWFPKLEELFKTVNSFLRMCWLKAIAGAWTTTRRMPESIKWPCIFGCTDCSDEIRHYIQCPILWQLAREALSISEQQFSIEHRLCLIDCSLDKLRLLAYSHLLYHALKNDRECVQCNGQIKSPQFIQQKGSNFSRALRPLV